MNKALLKQAQELQQQGQFSKAIEVYQKLLEEDSNQADILHIIGILQAQMARYNDALDSINKAIQLDPKQAPFYNSKGNVLLRLNKLEQADEAYREAIKQQADYASAYNNLGNSLYRQHLLEPAQDAYQKAIELNPNLSNAHYNLGILLSKLGKGDQAITALKKAIDLNSNYAAAYGQLGQVYLQQNNLDLAIENFRNRLALQPNNVDSQHDLGIALLKQERIDDAIAAFEKTLMLDSKYPECYQNLANAYLQSGDPNKALNYYFRQLEVEPLVESYYNIGVILMHQERHKEAVQYLNQAAILDRDYLPVHLNLGAIYLKLDDFSRATQHYREAARIKPKDPEIQHILTAISQEGTPKQAPTEYLQHLFDQYAPYYDKHLTEYLHYQVPEQLHQIITEEIDMDQPNWTILDLGCGTGLSGIPFKPLAKRLIGIDISEQMIGTAEQKNLYDELKVADITDALNEYQNLDLILAADVFAYFGDLSELFKKAKRALKSSALFAFSLESTGTQPYELQKTIRYAHSKVYIETLIKEYGFSILRFDNAILRRQKNNPVNGYLVVLSN